MASPPSGENRGSLASSARLEAQRFVGVDIGLERAPGVADEPVEEPSECSFAGAKASDTIGCWSAFGLKPNTTPTSERMNNLKVSGVLLFALLAAVAATFCDANHVYTRTLSYPAPLVAGQAWWVFPGFFVAFGFMGVTYAALARRLQSVLRIEKSRSAGHSFAFIETLVAFVLVYLLSGFGNESPRLLGLIFFGTFALRLAVTYERAWALLLAILLTVGGMFAEGLLALFGQVTYRHVDLFGVPFWLGGLFMHGAFALRESMRFFVYKDAQSRFQVTPAGATNDFPSQTEQPAHEPDQPRED